MIRLATLLAIIGACYRQPTTTPAAEEAQGLSSASCNADCTASITCRDVFSSCRFCSGGVCTATLPADPKPDAGVDAPPGGTTTP